MNASRKLANQAKVQSLQIMLSSVYVGCSHWKNITKKPQKY